MAYYEHLRREAAEGGQAGDLVYSPHGEPWEIDRAELEAAANTRWTKGTQEIDWARVWGLFEGPKIVGNLKLIPFGGLKTALHRSLLMMGIEDGSRGRGGGSALMKAALQWAREDSHLEWVQLYVFEENYPARRLYEKFHFKEVGRVEDMFRVHGKRITDIQMVLRIK